MTRPLNKLTHVAVAMAESVAMELEVVVGTYDSRIIGYSLDLLQKPEEQVCNEFSNLLFTCVINFYMVGAQKKVPRKGSCWMCAMYCQQWALSSHRRHG